MEKEVKGTRKMKEVLKTAVICFVMMLCILGLTDNVKAETVKDSNGVEIRVTTDKTEYKSGDTIRAEIVITNKGESTIENVSEAMGERHTAASEIIGESVERIKENDNSPDNEQAFEESYDLLAQLKD